MLLGFYREGRENSGSFDTASIVYYLNPMYRGVLYTNLGYELSNHSLSAGYAFNRAYFGSAKAGSSKITSPSTSVSRLVVAGSCGGGIVNTSWDSTAISAARPGAIRPLR